MASKRALFEGEDVAGSSSFKKKKPNKSDSELVEVKKEKASQNGAAAVQVGTIIRACYGTTNAETFVGEQVLYV